MRYSVVAVWLALVCVTSSCTSTPLRVSVVFENGWIFSKHMLSDPETLLVRNIALQTLRNAYSGCEVRFNDDLFDERRIKIEDAPYRSYGPGSIVSPGAGWRYVSCRQGQQRVSRCTICH